MSGLSKRRTPRVIAGSILLPTVLSACSAILLFVLGWIRRNGFQLHADVGSGFLSIWAEFWTFSVFGFVEHLVIYVFWMLMLPIVAYLAKPPGRGYFIIPLKWIPVWVVGSTIIFLLSVVAWNMALKLVVFRTVPDVHAICGILKLMCLHALSDR